MTMANLYIYIGVGARDLSIDELHRVLDIFRFVVFFSTGPQWTNLSLQTGLRSAGCFVDEKSQSFYGGGGLCLPSN